MLDLVRELELDCDVWDALHDRYPGWVVWPADDGSWHARRQGCFQQTQDGPRYALRAPDVVSLWIAIEVEEMRTTGGGGVPPEPPARPPHKQVHTRGGRAGEGEAA